MPCQKVRRTAFPGRPPEIGTASEGRPTNETEGSGVQWMPESDGLWYKDAIFYEVSVRSFLDSNEDGNGALRGLLAKLEYLKDLGLFCLWLMPFYPSPLKDDGYDIADFYKVHPTLGTVEDFEALT